MESATMDDFLAESVNGMPNLCGSEEIIARTMAGTELVFLPQSDVDFTAIRSAFSVALHMHQPLIPAGGGDPRTAAVISNLRFMSEHPEIADAHNAPVFRWCYKRMGEFIPQLVREGKSPRVMLDFSGCLLYGLREMGADDVIDSLRPLAQDPAYRRCVEWLGTAWGHAVAPSTPVQDFRLHVRAWQHHFAGMFGLEALGRVRGFSPPEMALPNHPDVCYEFVKTLLDCGYRWVLLQEHSVERFEDGGSLRLPHLPHRLIARNSLGQSLAITAIIKTQGSDTKLVAQMQPYYEALGLGRIELGNHQVPQLVTQIGDGENGGVMMNEFPSMFMRVMADASNSKTPALNAGEYLEHLTAAGVRDEDLPAVRPIYQKHLWDRLGNDTGPAALASAIAQLHQEDNRFHVEGGSWTSDISWVRGYDNVLGPMAKASALFAANAAGLSTNDPRYRNALFYLLVSQTSCFRYWGQGTWTDYGLELCRRTSEIASERVRT
jgi:hypothetical protein